MRSLLKSAFAVAALLAKSVKLKGKQNCMGTHMDI